MKTEIQKENLPIDWRVVDLGDMLERITNGLTCEQEKEPPGIPVTRIETISNGIVDFERVRYVRELDESKKARFLLQRGDILFTHINSDLHLGKTAVVTSDKPLLHGMNLLLLRTKKEQLEPYYLHYLLNFYRRSGTFMAIAQHAVNQSSLNQKKINSLKIPLAPLDQQIRIVAEIEKQFSRLDEAVAGLKRVKANLKRYKAAVLKAAVEGRLVETEAELARREGRSYETGAQLLQRILETRRSQWKGKGKYKEPAEPDTSDLPELPEGWVWATYAQIGEVTTGFTPPTADTDNFGGDIPFFKPTDLDAGDNVIMARKHLSKKGAAKGRLLPAGSVLVTCIGATIGKTGIARVDCATNQQINAVTPQSNLIDAPFVYSWTVSPYGYKQILDNASATTLPILNKSKFEALGIPIPPSAEQHRIVGEVDRRLSLIRVTEAQVDVDFKRADRLRQAILKKAFTGGRG